MHWVMEYLWFTLIISDSEVLKYVQVPIGSSKSRNKIIMFDIVFN